MPEPPPVPGPTGPTFFVSKPLNADFPLIDSDPHFKRVVAYARVSDWAQGVIAMTVAPLLFRGMDWVSPMRVQRASMRTGMRFAWWIGMVGGFLHLYQRSCMRFYGVNENGPEVERDMREMVARVKAGEPLYGVSRLSPHMQAVAARQSRYSPFFFHVLPWFNVVNHNQHGVDTAKYYRQAERELEMERLAAEGGAEAGVGAAPS